MKIASEALPLVVVLLVAVMVGGFALHPWVGVVLLVPLGFTTWFFRDPERRPPEDPELLVSPADGKIIKAGPDTISVFMNVFNVHVCRAPMAGRVETVRHTPGSFMSAYRDAASEHNERALITLEGGQRRLGFTMVAGLVARRIVCKVRPGQQLRVGERVGLIQFGSRVDVRLPEGGEIRVRVGQRVVAGETVIARLAVPEGSGEIAPPAVAVATGRPPSL